MWLWFNLFVCVGVLGGGGWVVLVWFSVWCLVELCVLVWGTILLLLGGYAGGECIFCSAVLCAVSLCLVFWLIFFLWVCATGRLGLVRSCRGYSASSLLFLFRLIWGLRVFGWIFCFLWFFHGWGLCFCVCFFFAGCRLLCGCFCFCLLLCFLVDFLGEFCFLLRLFLFTGGYFGLRWWAD